MVEQLPSVLSFGPPGPQEKSPTKWEMQTKPFPACQEDTHFELERGLSRFEILNGDLVALTFVWIQSVQEMVSCVFEI